MLSSCSRGARPRISKVTPERCAALGSCVQPARTRLPPAHKTSFCAKETIELHPQDTLFPNAGGKTATADIRSTRPTLCRGLCSPCASNELCVLRAEAAGARESVPGAASPADPQTLPAKGPHILKGRDCGEPNLQFRQPGATSNEGSLETWIPTPEEYGVCWRGFLALFLQLEALWLWGDANLSSACCCWRLPVLTLFPVFQVCEDGPPHDPSGPRGVHGRDRLPGRGEAQPAASLSLRSKAGHRGFLWPLYSIPVPPPGAREMGRGPESHPDPEGAHDQAPEDSSHQPLVLLGALLDKRGIAGPGISGCWYNVLYALSRGMNTEQGKAGISVHLGSLQSFYYAATYVNII